MPDIIDPVGGPALSATTDAVVISPDPAPEPPPVDPPQEAEPDAPAEEASAPEGEEDAAPEGEAEPAPQPQRGINRRFSELTAEKKVEQAKREAAEAHAARLEALLAEALAKQNQPPAQETKPEPPAVEPLPPRPQRHQFDDPDAYDAAIDSWNDARMQRTIDVRLAEQEQHAKAEREAAERETQQRQQQEQALTLDQAYAERVATTTEKYPDYSAVVEAPVEQGGPPFNDVMAFAIKQSEVGPDVAYHLASHREELSRIAALPPGLQLIEIGKLSATFTSETPPPAPRATPPRAPAPVNPIRRSNGPAVTRTLNDLGNEGSMEEYAAARQKQMRDQWAEDHPQRTRQ